MGKLEITAERVLQELAKLAFYDPGDFFEDDGSLKPIQDLDANTRMALAGLEVSELFEGKDVQDGPQQKTVYGLLKKVKLADKGINLERLGKHLKLFTEKLEVSNSDEQQPDLSQLTTEELKQFIALSEKGGAAHQPGS